MAFRDAWIPQTNFVEIGAKDGAIAASLLSRGFQRLLSITTSAGRRASIVARHPFLERHLVCSTHRKLVRANNADVLILSGRSTLALWNERNWRHAGHIAWVPRLSVFSVIAAALSLVYILAGRLRWVGLVSCGSAGRLAVLEVRHRKAHRHARRYVPHALGVAGFLGKLQEQGIRHAVLRWFESLPEVPPGEDLDLLVDDNHFEAVEGILGEGPGIQAVDVYTVTGLPGSQFGNMPYFPPRVAEEILTGASMHGGLCRVPSPKHHFLSMAYHALYHKGARSGIAGGGDGASAGSEHEHAAVGDWSIFRPVSGCCREKPPAENMDLSRSSPPDHDYAAVLRDLACKVGVDVPITLDALDGYLGQQGWRPPRDMLARLALRNPWARGLVGETAEGPEDAGLGVFVIRQEGLQGGGLAKVSAHLRHQGFEILTVKILSPRESRSAGMCIRGGNWGRGPWQTSGGPPAAAVVTYDPEPIKPTARQRRRFPGLTNARLLVKKKIRDALNQDLPESRRCNMLHSSDNGREALDYLRALIPEAVEEIQQRACQIRRAYATDEPVLRTITRFGRRAKIELIDFDGRLAIKKTFKPHQAHYCANEAATLRVLSPVVPEVPPVLRADSHSLVMPYYEDVLRYKRSSGKLFPLSAAKQAIHALRKVYEAGYALVDAHVENVLIDERAGLKLIDFEFCHRYDRKPPVFEESYDIVGCPAEFSGELPDGGSSEYARSWQPYVGLSLKSLLDDPTWLQHLKRGVYYLLHLPRFLPRRVRHYYRMGRDAIREPRRPPVQEDNGSLSRAA